MGRFCQKRVVALFIDKNRQTDVKTVSPNGLLLCTQIFLVMTLLLFYRSDHQHELISIFPTRSKCKWFDFLQWWWWFKYDWFKWATVAETIWTKNLNTAGKNYWLNWWFQKCKWFNRLQWWSWFKCDWVKWLTITETIWTNNFNESWNDKFWIIW
jgi:hypothetical protein